MILKDNEAQKYTGGGKVAAAIGVAIGFAVAFVLGIFDGYSNPKACRR